MVIWNKSAIYITIKSLLVQCYLNLTNVYMKNEVLGITNDISSFSNSKMYGKEPRYNQPLYNLNKNEVLLAITNDIASFSKSKMYGKEPDTVEAP